MRKKAPPGRRMVQQPWKSLELIQSKKKTQKQWGPVVAVEVEESCAKKKQKKKCNLHNKLRKACDSGQVDGTTYSCDLAGS